jgi:diadenosine tetraphosphate (Ap4A) HIT family hydrolase
LPERRSFDAAGYIESIQTRPCFICALVAGDPAFAHHVVFEDDFAIAFLNKYPAVVGHVLICPKMHVEQVTGDLNLEDYLRLQAVVYEVSNALRRVLDVERVYVISLGSQQGNRHVHWHVAPLPPGVPFEEQQFAALDVERAGYLAMDEAEMKRLADRISGSMLNARS